MSDLNNYEERYSSQNGEDGIIQEIFNRISRINSFFVEFGVESGVECNTRYLYEKGWNGLMIEGDEKFYQGLLGSYSDAVRKEHAFITKDNIVDIFKKNSVPKYFDLLSVDVDGNDYWILKEILKEYIPSVIIAEYNAYYKPHAKWIMKYNPLHTWDGTSYQGASLQSMTNLCNENNYKLVATDSKGVNAFYVHGDFMLGSLKELTPSEAYHPARYYGHLNGGKYGHPYQDGEYVEE